MKNIHGQKVTKEDFLNNLGFEMLIAGGVLLGLTLKEVSDSIGTAISKAIERRRWKKEIDKAAAEAFILKTLADLEEDEESEEEES